MSKDELIDRIRALIEIEFAGSQADFAKAYGVSAAYVSEVLRGCKDPGEKILSAVGFERVVNYQSKPLSMIKIISINWIGNHTTDERMIDFLAKFRETVIGNCQDFIFISPGSLPEDWMSQCEACQVALENADVMLYPTKKTANKAEEIFQSMCRAVAILSFVKQGVEIFGMRFESTFDFDGDIAVQDCLELRIGSEIGDAGTHRSPELTKVDELKRMLYGCRKA